MRFTIQGSTAGKPRRLSPSRVSVGSGAKAVRGNRRSCEAPREFVGKENVVELRALVGAQPVISPLPLQIGKIQGPAVEPRGRVQDSPGGRRADDVEAQARQV